MKKDRIASTVGMMAYHPHMYKSGMVRVAFYKTKIGVELHAISANNAERIRNIKTVTISFDDFNDRPDPQTQQCDEFFWSIRKLGFEIAGEEFLI